MSSCLKSHRTLGIAVAAAVSFAGLASSDVLPTTGFDEALQQAIDATVFVKVDRLYRGDGIRTTGTGFVIHEDGWVLTNAHVVSDTISIPGQDEVRKAKSAVSGITVVIGSGESGEREVKARVVARDTDLDLALLKIPGPVAPTLKLAQADQHPSVTDPVWVIGFPYGELLSMERWQRDHVANPVPSVNQGRISALRRNDDGELRHLQTDAAVNPGNSGGPMLDAEGRVVGVVFAKVGESGVGFAVAAGRVVEFMHTRGYRVRIQPPSINQTTKSITVTLDSTLVALQQWNGQITISGGDTETVVRDMTPTATGLRGVVPLGRNAAASAGEGLLRASIELSPPDGDAVTRVFRLRGADTRMQADASTTESISASTTTEPGDEVEAGKPRSLGGLGGGGAMSAAKTEGDGVVDEDRTIGMYTANDVLFEVRKILTDPKRYEALENEEHIALAKRYDEVAYGMARIGVYGEHATQPSQLRSLRLDALSLVSNAEVLHAKLRTANLCRCDEVWRLCADPLPNECEQPWVEDDLTELREILTQ